PNRLIQLLRCIGGRLPLTEQRVKADTRKYHSNNYLCDFMSHPKDIPTKNHTVIFHMPWLSIRWD
ncbi:hypothetical protein ACIXUK_07630, partial [Bacteroides fragilis]